MIFLNVPKSITFVKSSQVSPACPSDKSSVKIKIHVEFWSNGTEREKPTRSEKTLAQWHDIQ
jgi:hypothetical protein